MMTSPVCVYFRANCTPQIGEDRLLSGNDVVIADGGLRGNGPDSRISTNESPAGVFPQGQGQVANTA